MSEKAKKIKFSGHQTFAFRYGWLEKGVNAVAETPTIFGQEDALVQLGVGKNMVESIRHWCQLAQLIEPLASKGVQSSTYGPTPVAKKIFLRGGWDRFLENDASLWLIHWLIVTNPTIATSWQLTFGHFHRPDFSKRELIDYAKSHAEKHSTRVNESSLSRDIDCLLRTYLPARNGGKNQSPEEAFDCPLQELGLLQASHTDEFFRFAIGAKPSLPPQVFAFALDQFARRLKSDKLATLTIQECLYGIQSPGQVFKLDENSVVEHIEQVGDLTDNAIELNESAGLKQIFWRERFDPLQLLQDYYKPKDR